MTFPTFPIGDQPQMTRYKLPDFLGGHECMVESRHSGSVTVSFVHDGIKNVITVQKGVLVEVVPPLPAEPHMGAAVRDGEGDVWQRQTDGWRTCGSYEKHDWATLSKYPLTRLVPDPAADAPALLPWDWTDAEGGVGSVVHCRVPGTAVSIQADDVYLTPDDCREMAGVLWRAAQDHEEAGRD